MRRTIRSGLIAATALLLLSGGGAYAYWSVIGSGSGTAASGSAAAVVVNQTSSASGLYPGGSVALSGDFDNPNPGAVYVTAVTAAVRIFSAQADNTKPACTQADFTITGTSNTPGSIASGTAVGSWSGLTLTMVNSGTNQDNCKSLAAVQIDYTAN